MPELNTTHIGRIRYNEQDTLEFPAGLPGFDQERAFLPIEVPTAKPILLFQSLQTPGLCFMTLPVLVVDPQYRLNMTREDLRAIGLAEEQQPAIGPDVLCVAILSVSEDQAPTANLLAPLVVNFKTHRAVQAIQVESDYSHQHALPAPEPEAKEC
jgi:flagellar assembly factor FliW